MAAEAIEGHRFFDVGLQDVAAIWNGLVNIELLTVEKDDEPAEPRDCRWLLFLLLLSIFFRQLFALCGLGREEDVQVDCKGFLGRQELGEFFGASSEDKLVEIEGLLEPCRLDHQLDVAGFLLVHECLNIQASNSGKRGGPPKRGPGRKGDSG